MVIIILGGARFRARLLRVLVSCWLLFASPSALLMAADSAVLSEEDSSVKYSPALPDWFKKAIWQHPPLSWSDSALLRNLQDYIPNEAAVTRTRASILADYKTRLDAYMPPAELAQRVPMNPNGTLRMNVSGTFRGMSFTGQAVADGFWVRPGNKEGPLQGRGRGVTPFFCSPIDLTASVSRVRGINCNVLFADALFASGSLSPKANMAALSNNAACDPDCQRMASAIQELSCGRDCAAEPHISQSLTRAPSFKVPLTRDALLRFPGLSMKYIDLNLSLYKEWVFDPLEIGNRRVSAVLQGVDAVVTAPLCNTKAAVSIMPPVDSLLFQGSRFACVDLNGVLTRVFWDDMAKLDSSELVSSGDRRVSCVQSVNSNSSFVGHLLFPPNFSDNASQPFMFLVASKATPNSTSTAEAEMQPHCIIRFYQTVDPETNNRAAAQLNVLHLTKGFINSSSVGECTTQETVGPTPGYALNYSLSFTPASSLNQSSEFWGCAGNARRCYLYLSHDLQGIMDRWNSTVPVSKMMPDTQPKSLCSAFEGSDRLSDGLPNGTGAGEVARAVLEDMINAGIRMATGADRTVEIQTTASQIQGSIDAFSWVQITTSASTSIAGIGGFMALNLVAYLDRCQCSCLLIPGSKFAVHVLAALAETFVVTLSTIVTLAVLVDGGSQEQTISWAHSQQNLAADGETFDYFVSGSVTLVGSVPQFGLKVMVLTIAIALALVCSLWRWLDYIDSGKTHQEDQITRLQPLS